jgi:hypothetical protein
MKPTIEDAKEFKLLVEQALTKRNVLSDLCLIEFDISTQENVFNHVFYNWINDPSEFRWAVDYCIQKKLITEPVDRFKIRLASIIATLYIEYKIFNEYPERLKIASPKTINSAITQIDSLLGVLGSAISMNYPQDASSLRILLVKLKIELQINAPHIKLESKRGDYISRYLIERAGLLLQDLVNESPTYVVLSIVNIITPVDDRRVRQVINSK